MQVLETDWWSLLLPAEWSAEHEDGIVVIGDRDGVGCIEISEWQPEEGKQAESLHELAEANTLPGASWTPCRLGAFSGLHSAGAEEGMALREWYLQSGRLLLYITYSCELANAGMDDAAVDEILGTLSVSPDLPR